MDRSSTSLGEEALVNHIVELCTPTTTRVTNRVRFTVGINPAGMALIKSIDPEAMFGDRFRHNAWAVGAMHHARVVDDDLRTVEGFCKLYDWIVHEPEELLYAKVLLLSGFPYEVMVGGDSPLVGWFNVLKGVSND